jgi:hypothetical protein
VRTFLRTYADYLGLDSRALLEEYRQRYERPSAHELTPFQPNRGRRPRRRRFVFAPWLAILLGLAVLVVLLYVLGTWGQGDDGDNGTVASSSPTPSATRTATPTPTPRPQRVRLQIVATGLVSVCVEDARGRPLVDNVTFSAGQTSAVFRSRRFLVSFGTADAQMRINGKTRPVSQNTPIGYEIRPGRSPRVLPESRRPTCQ